MFLMSLSLSSFFFKCKLRLSHIEETDNSIDFLFRLHCLLSDDKKIIRLAS